MVLACANLLHELGRLPLMVLLWTAIPLSCSTARELNMYELFGSLEGTGGND